MKLKNIIGLDKICLRSKSLARLYGDFGGLKELVVEDAPNLEELVGIGLPSGKAKVKIVFAPKLQVLGYLGITVRPLILYDTVHDVMFSSTASRSRSSDHFGSYRSEMVLTSESDHFLHITGRDRKARRNGAQC